MAEGDQQDSTPGTLADTLDTLGASENLWNDKILKRGLISYPGVSSVSSVPAYPAYPGSRRGGGARGKLLY